MISCWTNTPTSRKRKQSKWQKRTNIGTQRFYSRNMSNVFFFLVLKEKNKMKVWYHIYSVIKSDSCITIAFLGDIYYVMYRIYMLSHDMHITCEIVMWMTNCMQWTRARARSVFERKKIMNYERHTHIERSPKTKNVCIATGLSHHQQLEMVSHYCVARNMIGRWYIWKEGSTKYHLHAWTYGIKKYQLWRERQTEEH